MEEHGIVVKINADTVWIETIPRNRCRQCDANKHCGSEFKPSPHRFKLATSLSLQLGEEVVLGLPQQLILQSALLIYGLPLLNLFMFAAIYESVSKMGILPAGEGGVMLAGFSGLIAGYLGVKWLIRGKRYHYYQPVIVRRLTEDVIPYWVKNNENQHS